MGKKTLVGMFFVTTVVLMSFHHADRKIDLWLNNPLKDSIKVLIRADGFVMGINNPPTNEEARLWSITKSMYNLTFEQLEEMILHDNPYVSLYGIMIASGIHYDSLIDKNYPILSDTSEIKFHGLKEEITEKFTAGQLALMMIASAKEIKRLDAKTPELKKIIQTFLKKYSKFPTSYKSISFSEYSSIELDEENENFEFKHTYWIKDKHNRLDSVTHYFLLDSELSISLIESARTNMSTESPPNLSHWLTRYGKSLSKSDSTDLKLIKTVYPNDDMIK